MDAKQIISHSLVLFSLGAFACSKPKPTRQDTASIVSHEHSDMSVGTEVESPLVMEAPAEPAKAAQVPPQIDSFTVNQKLDLVLAIDEAVGDGRGVDVLATQLNLLGKALSTAMDTQIHLLLGNPLPLPDLDAKKIGFVDTGVGPTDIIGLLGTLFANGFAEAYIDAAGDALAAPLAFRNDAKLEVLIFSTGNGEDEGNLAVDFDPNNALKANVSAVVALADSVESDECTIDAVGQEYIDLSKKLNGTLLDVCSADFARIFNTLAFEMTKRNLSFKLAQKPLDPRTITVTVNDKPVPKEAWFYDGKNNAVAFLSAAALVSGGKVEVKYEPAKAP